MSLNVDPVLLAQAVLWPPKRRAVQGPAPPADTPRIPPLRVVSAKVPPYAVQVARPFICYEPRPVSPDLSRAVVS